jgi:hypothetical protein
MNSRSGLIIGVSGVAGSGKSTVADILTDLRFVTISLADPIKRLVRDLYAFTDEQLWGPSACRNEPDKRYPRADGTFLTPREALQRFGTEAGRACYDNTWVDRCLLNAQLVLSGQFAYAQALGVHDYRGPGRPEVRGVAIPDVRFMNEIAAIHAAGGVVIRIVRPGAGLEGAAGAHGSETEQASIPDSEFDYVLDNSATLEQLRENVHRCARAIRRPPLQAV